jgi:hypothetical protein
MPIISACVLTADSCSANDDADSNAAVAAKAKAARNRVDFMIRPLSK